MKITISDNGNYAVKAELVDAVYPSEITALKFTSHFYGAADPNEEQHKFTLFLNAEERQKLKNML